MFILSAFVFDFVKLLDLQIDKGKVLLRPLAGRYSILMVFPSFCVIKLRRQ